MKYRAKITNIVATLITEDCDDFYYEIAKQYGNTVKDDSDIYLECDSEEVAECFEEMNKEYYNMLHAEQRIKELVKIIKFLTWKKSK